MLMNRRPDSSDQGGFTLVELTVALVLLTVALLGLGASTAGLVRSTAEEEVRATLLQAVDDRLAEVRMDPRYASLDSLYESTEADVLGLDGYTRTTNVNRVRQTQSSGRVRDYTVIRVSVTGPALPDPLARIFVLAAP